jgi:beta-lactamase regulating signal transducer with metallopeptidase domain
MTNSLGSLIATVCSALGALLMIQFDFDGWSKIIGNITVMLFALGAIVTMIYYLWNQRSRSHLETTLKELREANADLRSENSDCEKAIAKKNTEILALKEDKGKLIIKLTAERKLTLTQAAKIQGIPLSPDHYDDLDEFLNR